MSDSTFGQTESLNAKRKLSTARVQTPFQALMDPNWLKAFARHLWRHFREDRNLEAAGALSYTSLLALVPLMAVMLGVISAFPVFDQWAKDVETYIFSNFVPAAGDTVHQYITEFVGRTAGLTGAGTAFLIVTAILLMASIEKNLNRIWRVRTQRQPVNRLVIYWAVLTLGPLLVGASLGLTSYFAALPLLAPEIVRGLLQELLLKTAPFFVALIGFALVFIVVPNRRVRWRHALAGAFVSAVMFESAKAGFVFYVTNFPTYERLYGALATIPLFFVWIYVSWAVVLLGASVAAALTTFQYRRADGGWPARRELQLALRLMGHFWQAQRRGQSLSVTDLMDRERAADDEQLNRILAWFHDARFIHADDDGDWMLSADLDELRLGDLYQSGPFILPLQEFERLELESHWDRALVEGLKPVDVSARPVLDRSIKSLLTFTPETS